MTVYEWSSSEKYADYSGVQDADCRKVRWFDPLLGDPLPPVSEWTPPRLRQYLGENGKQKLKKIGDAPVSGFAHFISQRALDVLREMWESHSEIYPVYLEDADSPFYMIVPVLVVDALDRERSTGTRRKYSGDVRHFSLLETWKMKEELLEGKVIFQLPDTKSATYVTEEFRASIVRAGLKGFCLKETYWEASPFCS